MRIHPDVIGVLTSESLMDLFGGPANQNEIRAYRAYLQERIEDKYSLICSFSTAEHGPLEFRVQPQVAYRISEAVLYTFERECRASFKPSPSEMAAAAAAHKDSGAST